MSARPGLEERLDLAQRDLLELNEQVQIGEVDGVRAETLRVAYEQEIEEVARALLSASSAVAAEAGSQPPERDMWPRKYLVGGGILIVVLSVAIFMAGRGVGGSSAQGSDLSITIEQLEAMVAADPEVLSTRMSLADRYFDSQDLGKALEHYLFVVDNNPGPAEQSHAVGRIGWMAFLSGEPEIADQYVRAGLEADSNNGEAKLFLGFITLYGLEDPAGAIPLLEEVASMTEIPPDTLGQVEDALADARRDVDGNGDGP